LSPVWYQPGCAGGVQIALALCLTGKPIAKYYLAMKANVLMNYNHHSGKTARALFSFLLLFGFLHHACRQPAHKKLPWTSSDISCITTRMTEIMVHDITNPPLAARFFSYTCLAGYEIISQHDSRYTSMHISLNSYPPLKKPGNIGAADYQLAALLAMMETAKKIQPSGKLMEEFEDKFIDSCSRSGIDPSIISDSKKYAAAISADILAYAKADGYNRISNLPRYTPLKGDYSWYPTPPGFMAAVEPYFNTLRPFTLDSVAQFKPVPPVTFNNKKGSPFYTLTEAVYRESKMINQEHRAIAAFWDCNPFAMQDGGHLQFGFKKISPGAHWMGITGFACKKANKDFNASLEVYTAVAITLMDAFMCCWDEKFRSNRIRPETAIRRFLDPQWEPLLQTPPFPEYVSGHSTISAAAAVILTHYIGDNFNFTDSAEISYGLPPRQFRSFKEAAAEAGLSRFYGGIHFMDAIDNGMLQGQLVGQWTLQRLRQKK
jgi:hypothetical protein